VAEKRSVSVRIRGQEFRIRSDESEESLQRIAGYLDETMKSIEARTGTVDSRDVALLTALNLARELMQVREGRHPSLETGVESARMRSLIELAESALEPDRA
jgi:cell division protein ZapA